MADPAQFSAGELLSVLAVSGLLGMVGQGARAVAGLKKLNDFADSSSASSDDLFLASRLVVSMVIGFIAGVVAALALGIDKLLHFSSDNVQVLLGIAAAGYVGADFIEAFTRKIAQTAPPTIPGDWSAAAPASTLPAATTNTEPRILRGDGSFPFTAEVVDNDIVVRNVSATWFGGPNDASDNGQTASGVSTVDNPNLMGCALPMDGFNHPKTDGSPIPRLPWNTMVRVTNRDTEGEISLPLIDLGPSKFAPSHAAIDLTESAFQSLGVDPTVGVMKVDFTVVGGASFVKDSAPGSSLNKPDNVGGGGLTTPADDSDPGHGPDADVQKPPIKQFIQSPNHSSRNGTAIDMVVLHFTDGPTAQGAINTFLNTTGKRVSAHYIIDRNGDIYQMVDDGDAAWHAKAANARSIGIEHVAVEGQRMAPAQEQSSIALVRWLMATYDIPKSKVTGHRFAPGNIGTTDCPDHLFGDATEQAVRDWVDQHLS